MTATVTDIAMPKAAQALNQKLSNLAKELDAVFLERTELIKLLLTAYIAKTNVFVGGPPGCQPAGSKALMADGRWKNVEDVKTGDLVMSPQHDNSVSPKQVIDTFVYDDYPVYRIKANSKGNHSYLCSGNHILPVIAHKVKDLPGSSRSKPKRQAHSVLQEMSVEAFLQKSKEYQKRARVFSSPAYDLPAKDYLIHPYVMGCILGDGCVCAGEKGNSFASSDPAIFAKMEDFGAEFGKKRLRGNCQEACFTGQFAKLLRQSVICGTTSRTKFIPEEYLQGSIEQRLWLLAGLIDTDGNAQRFTTTSDKLASQFEALIFSVGGWATATRVSRDIKGIPIEAWDIYYVPSEYSIPVQCRHKFRIRDKNWKNHRNRSFSVEYIRQDRVYGFELESGSQWYVTDGYLVTHNTGKTMLAKAVAQAFNTRSFYYLMNATTQVDELLGVVDLAALQNSEFRRDLTGKLADVELAILDEIFKSNSPCLNTLLGIILDHEVPNGKHVHQCPLVSLVGCSNELPQEESLAPFWDRFTLRYWVEDVTHRNKKTLLQRASGLKPTPAVTVQFTLTDLEQMQQEAQTLRVSEDAIDGILDISKRLSGEGITASTRKHVQMISLLRAYAYVCGDSEVTEEHLALLSHVFWNDLKDRETINKTVKEVLEAPHERLNSILTAAQAVVNKLAEIDTADTIRYKAYLGGADSKLAEMLAELDREIKNNPHTNSKGKLARKIHAHVVQWRQENILNAMTQLEFGI